ncbi:Piso0_003975 [Millerozyma farinosa CBS 7064]|uniref:Piso0_003975 protein n=1 Tax=Pichia sorbitophila (strain ATCC MYA-4447 / BCRC 22081 / CBS 7064 / NBRC 10061 / NRRL Y-12695) TaxID=559304 RepID=G8YA17_PICSO|nr:Piso0_003975 [Millerozyma farinosa CBS 7064]CCE84431.1 Piso0_003975 [Millerozyma farinosa CBS 7064]
MGEENSNKRKLEEEHESTKKLRQDSPDSADEDLNYLKESIKKELTKTFEDKFERLEKELREVKQLVKESCSVPSSAAQDAASKMATAPKLQRKSINPFDKVEKEQEETQTESNKEGQFGTNSNDTKKPLFGSSSLRFATPLNSLASNTNPAKTPPDSKTAETSPKPVFGVTTTFGNNSSSNQVGSKDSIFGASSDSAEKSESTASNSTASFGSTFGANSKFSGAFSNALKKKSFLDGGASEKSNSEEAQGKDESESRSSAVPEQYKQVNLAPVTELRTGEEDEKSHFTATVKMFDLDLSNVKEGWKERGLGPLHLNQSLQDPKQVRLVMRSQGLLRVILNVKISPETKLLKGLETSLTPGKYLRFASLNEQGKPVQNLLKFSSEALRDELFTKVQELQDQIKN